MSDHCCACPGVCYHDGPPHFCAEHRPAVARFPSHPLPPDLPFCSACPALRARAEKAEAALAGATDCVNTAIRETGPSDEQVDMDRLREGIDTLLCRANRRQAERDEARRELAEEGDRARAWAAIAERLEGAARDAQAHAARLRNAAEMYMEARDSGDFDDAIQKLLAADLETAAALASTPAGSGKLWRAMERACEALDELARCEHLNSEEPADVRAFCSARALAFSDARAALAEVEAAKAEEGR